LVLLRRRLAAVEPGVCGTVNQHGEGIKSSAGGRVPAAIITLASVAAGLVCQQFKSSSGTGGGRRRVMKMLEVEDGVLLL
jgi:hypothetical protein